MAGDDDDVVGPLGAALDGDHVADPGRRRNARAGDHVARVASGVAAGPRALELRLGPVERRADPALRVGLRRERVPRAEADQLLDRPLHLRAADRRDDRLQLRVGRRAAAPRRSAAGRDSSPSLRIATLLSPRLATGICAAAGLGEPQPTNARFKDAFSCCASIDHFIGGASFASGGPQRRRVRPQPGRRCRRRSASAPRPTSQKAMDAAKAAQPAWAATNPQRRARVMFKFKELVEAHMDELAAAAVVRAWQGHRRRQGRHPARARGDRICLRHPARAEGRIYRRRRARHRRLFDAPAARHRRRHHAVQLPGDDPDVDVRHGDRLRQRLHPEAVRARPHASRCASPN